LCKKAYQLFPVQRHLMFFKLGMKRKKEKRYVQAIDAFKKALDERDILPTETTETKDAKKPKSVPRSEILELLADCCKSAAEYEQSLGYYKAVVDGIDASAHPTLCPKHETLYLALIDLATRNELKSYALAKHYIGVLKKNFELTPKQKVTFGERYTNCFLVLGEWDEMKAELDYLFSCEFEKSKYLLTLKCICEFHYNNYTESISAGKAGVHDDMGTWNTRYIGRSHMMLGMFEEANKYFNLYLAKRKNSIILLELASLHLVVASPFYDPVKAQCLVKESLEIFGGDNVSFDYDTTLSQVQANLSKELERQKVTIAGESKERPQS